MVKKKTEAAALFELPAFVHCEGVAECEYPAKYSLKINDVWMKVCHACYSKHFENSGLSALEQYGLTKLPEETTEQWATRMRQFCRNGLLSINQRNGGR